MHLFYFALLIALLGLQASRAAEWGYWGKNGPENWQGICTTGKKQSPIDIETEETIIVDFDALKFNRYNLAFQGTLTNTGHSVEIQLTGLPIMLSGGNLPSTYLLDHMQFHWSAEHTVDSIRHPLELHLMHYNQKYKNFNLAKQHENGIAVIAVFFKLSDDDNEDLVSILATKLISFNGVKSVGQIRDKIIPLMFLPEDHTTYYTYQGSLTTPGCDESVIWIVMTEELFVSEAQVNVFRHMESGNGTLRYNNRPIQDLNAREVYYHIESAAVSGASLFTSNSISVVFILSVLFINFLREILILILKDFGPN